MEAAGALLLSSSLQALQERKPALGLALALCEVWLAYGCPYSLSTAKPVLWKPRPAKWCRLDSRRELRTSFPRGGRDIVMGLEKCFPNREKLPRSNVECIH